MTAPLHNPTSSDPLDTPDYDPLAHLNQLFPHPSTLSRLPLVSSHLHQHLAQLDHQIVDLVTTQSLTNADAKQRISATKHELSELFKNIDTVRARAQRTEEAITEMTRDIKTLDSTKRNLTLSMTMLKRLQMLTTAFEQLKTSTRTRQYKECAGLLSAVLSLMTHFKTYRSIPPIASLSRSITAVRSQLLEQVAEDFEMVFTRQQLPAKLPLLAEACLVVDALGPEARQRIINWYANTQLREYRQVFKSEEAGGLDNIGRRYAWFRKVVRQGEEEHKGIWPAEWEVEREVARMFCEGTRGDYNAILAKTGRGTAGEKKLDVGLLVQALGETLEFESWLEKRFGGDKKKGEKADEHPVFERAISSAFEPYLSLWVDAQDAQLSKMIPAYRHTPLRPSDPDEDFVPATAVHPSSIDLFHFYRQTFSQCAKLSTGPRLLELARVFTKHLHAYADTVLSSYLTLDLAPAELAVILNTADYCHTTTLQLQDRIKTRIDKPLAATVNLDAQADLFLSLVSAAIARLVARAESALDPAWREMRNGPWARMDAVADQSGYVGLLTDKLTAAAADALAVIGKDTWRRSFCDRLVDAVAHAFAQALAACRPIGCVGAEQLLLDVYAVQQTLEGLMTLQREEAAPPPQSYVKHVQRTVARLNAVLKTLQVEARPEEGIVQAYLIHVADASPANFRKVLDLKGVRKAEQPAYVELFNAHKAGYEGLAESHGLLAGLSTSVVGAGSGAAGTGTPREGEGRGGRTLESLSAALAEGVGRFGEREGGDGGGRLGRFFKGGAAGGFRLGRDGGGQ